MEVQKISEKVGDWYTQICPIKNAPCRFLVGSLGVQDCAREIKITSFLAFFNENDLFLKVVFGPENVNNDRFFDLKTAP